MCVITVKTQFCPPCPCLSIFTYVRYYCEDTVLPTLSLPVYIHLCVLLQWRHSSAHPVPACLYSPMCVVTVKTQFCPPCPCLSMFTYVCYYSEDTVLPTLSLPVYVHLCVLLQWRHSSAHPVPASLCSPMCVIIVKTQFWPVYQWLSRFLNLPPCIQIRLYPRPWLPLSRRARCHDQWPIEGASLALPPGQSRQSNYTVLSLVL